MSRTAAIALATAAVAAATPAGLAGPAGSAPNQAEAATAKPPPALATGTSDPSGLVDRAPARWRLLGRRLTVTLPGGVHPGAPANRVVTAHAQCGESTVAPLSSDEIYPWATVTRGSARVKASARTVRITLARDLAARTNLCELTVAASTGLGSASARAAMRVRRGPARGCRPGPRERVVHESDTIRVTTARATSTDGTYVDGYRACRLPRGNLRRIERAGDSGGAGGNGSTAARFASSGRQLAWVNTYTPHSELGGVRTATVRQVRLPGGPVLSVDSAPGTISTLALDASGVTAWVRQPLAPATATLQAHAPGGTVVVLDRVLPIVCVRAPCEGAGPITHLSVRHRTVRWRNADIPRRATLP